MIEDAELRELFRAESNEHLTGLEAGLLALERGDGDPDTLDAVFRDAHSLKGAARMLGLGDIETLMHAIEERLRLARDQGRAPPPAQLAALLPAIDAAQDLAREAVEGERARIELRALLGALRADGDAATAGTARAVQAPTAPQDTAVEPAAPPPKPAEPATPPAPRSRRTLHMSRAPRFSRRPPHPAPDPSPADPSRPRPMQPGRRAGRAPTAGSEPRPGRWRIDTIRIGTAKLDALLRDCGELIVTQQRIGRLAEPLDNLAEALDAMRRQLERPHADPQQALELLQGLPGLAREAAWLRERLGDDGRRLDTLARRLSEGVRDARLLPLSTLFDLCPRLVRDIAGGEGKAVELLIEGGDTTADKHVVEGLKDPLMHILRNAVHHGIEPPEARRRAGKPEQGRIRIRAERGGARVI
jgi:two-component system chemotaxis sensor kinase CheA